MAGNRGSAYRGVVHTEGGSIMRRAGSEGAKRATNVSVPGDLLDAARGVGVNLSALLERALVEELARLRRLRWRAENAEAIAAYNDHLQQYGAFRTTGRSF